MPIYKIQAHFALGQIVYLKTDVQQTPYMVIAIELDINMAVIYELSYCGQVTRCYVQEISEDRSFSVN